MEINNDTFLKIVRSFVDKGGSDIHFSSKNKVAFRVKGKLLKYGEHFLTKEETLKIYDLLSEYLSDEIKDFNDKNIATHFHTGFGMTVELSKSEKYRFRVNTAKNRGGYYIVLRIINAVPPKLTDLGFTKSTFEGLEWITKRQAGIFLVVGATGSGKSTTLAAMLRKINEDFQKNIITLEDPIEFVHESISSQVVQKELGKDILDFQEGLASALREDPDVVLIGEIRDAKTLDLSMKAAETGHLVFSTLHTAGTIETIQRLSAMSDNPTLTRSRLSQTLLGAIAQKLAVNTRGKRIAIWEMMIVDKQASVLIKESNDTQLKGMLDTLKWSQSYNYTIRDLYRRNEITEEDALLYSPEPKYLNLEQIEQESGNKTKQERQVIKEKQEEKQEEKKEDAPVSGINKILKF